MARETVDLLPAVAHRQCLRRLLRAGCEGERVQLRRSGLDRDLDRGRPVRSGAPLPLGAVASGGMWFQSAVVYQIYPRSFADSDGDGIGDLGGISAHLEHLAALHVEAVWLSPFFRSPMADLG